MEESCGYDCYDEEVLEDTRYQILVNSAGHYLISGSKGLRTYRPTGRGDYQLIYVRKGQGHFYLNGERLTVRAGSLVLYYPAEIQNYEYPADIYTEVYWVHVTGNDIREQLRACGFPAGGIYEVGYAEEYADCFLELVKELQLKRAEYGELCGLQLCKLLHYFKRNVATRAGEETSRMLGIEAAIRYFHDHYRETLSIADFAVQQGVTVCWFIRCFKKHTGMTPQRYITQLRMQRAKELLIGDVYNVSEVADLTGYQNPLYFSRMFKKYTGVSPSRYYQERSLGSVR